MDVVDVQYFTFKLSYIKLLVYASIDEYCFHNIEQFGGCVIEIKQILSNLQGF